ncbi:MAG: hypothetical protein ACR2FU_07770 [Streptosporangiaceae bacterium]
MTHEYADLAREAPDIFRSSAAVLTNPANRHGRSPCRSSNSTEITETFPGADTR